MPLTKSVTPAAREVEIPAPRAVPAARTSTTRDTEAERRRARSVAKQQQAAERIAAASAEVSAQTAESAAASRQLRESMEQIASGAEEASSSCQESLSVVSQVSERIKQQQKAAERSQTLTRSLQVLVTATTGGIGELLTNVSAGSERQSASVAMISELERQAEEIGEIVKTVARIADQTNLLALNAAIEAARARQHGKGFAVVADEVRTLAETSERSAREIRSLIDEVRSSVTSIASSVQAAAETSRSEVTKGQGINEQLGKIVADLVGLLDGASEIAAAASQSERAAQDVQIRSEEIAAASEEQSAAAEESMQTVEQQGAALRQSEKASETLSEIADELRTSSDIGKSAESVAASADELSAAAEEINRSAAQISTAIGQISGGAQAQASKSQEAASALNQIETGARLARDRAGTSVERADVMIVQIADNKAAVESMIEAIETASTSARENVRQVVDLELIARKIDKIVDAIANVSIQTNMLAVNGSVESARAGEFGKGFAVVSTDIRNLARDSAENADRIKDLVKEVQDRIAIVRSDLDETSREALSEVVRARSTTSRLIEVERDMGEMRAAGEVVRSSAQQIAEALGEVKEGLDQIATAATQADALSTQASTAARQQSQGAEDLAAAIEEIAALADTLQNG